MAWECNKCGRGGLSTQTRSKSMVATKTKQKVNLQVRHIDGLKVRVCARCIKSKKKE